MLVASGYLFQRAHWAVAISKESLSFSGDHGMMPPVSLPFGLQTLFKMSFQARAPDTSIKLIAATATDVLIIASS
jgi:hypothetical protein